MLQISAYFRQFIFHIYLVLFFMVEWYEKERQEHLESVAALLKENDPLFVGRTAFVRKILEVFQDSHSTGCRCVLVYGLAGTGKTKLAVESCALYKKQQTGSLTR